MTDFSETVEPFSSMPTDGSSGESNTPTTRGSHMKVLFVMLHAGFVRHYASVIRALAAKGHLVHIAYEDAREKLGEQQDLRQLTDKYPQVTAGPLPHRFENVRQVLLRSDPSAERSGRFDRRPSTSDTEMIDEHGKLLSPGGKLPDAFEQAWEGVATAVRLMQDYLRYFDPDFHQSPRLLARAQKRVPKLLRAVIAVPARSGRLARSVVGWLLRNLERVIPIPTGVNIYLKHQSPDVLFVTPLVDFGSQQVDYIKTARRLGIPSIHGVASWDNLTSKGLVRVHADRVLVWNERQKEEAQSLHGVPSEKVVVTGAQTFDEWFERKPSRTREEFGAMVGLSHDQKYILYLGSSSFIAPNELDFVERWITAIRSSSNPTVSACGILIRPHPANSRQFRAINLERWPAISVWPPIGFEPGDTDFKRDYFDSLFYSGVVVGINTSALIEAAVVGRITCTVRDEDFVHAQVGAVHFRHLTRENEGCLVIADDLETHVRQLSPILSGETKNETRPFIEAFVRPRGMQTAVTSYIVKTVETIAAAGSRPKAESIFTPATRVLVYPVALVIRALASGRTVTFVIIRPIISVGVFLAAAAYRFAYVVRDTTRAFRRAWRNMGNEFHQFKKKVRRELRRVPKTMLHSRKQVRKAVRSVRSTVNHRTRLVYVKAVLKQVIRRSSLK
jgi:hypothetical protein